MLFSKKQRNHSIEDQTVKAQTNKHIRRQLLTEYKPFIASIVSEVCQKKIDPEKSDEFSIGLSAFNEAIDLFDRTKSNSFLSFASMIIKRRVIDYIRKELKSVMPHSLDEADNSFEASYAKKKFEEEERTLLRKEEIRNFQVELKQFGVSFEDLVENGPKHNDTKKIVHGIAKTIVENSEVLDQLLIEKKLPIRKLEEKEIKISRKTIEKHRKYIIALVILLTGDYVYLREFVQGVKL